MKPVITTLLVCVTAAALLPRAAAEEADKAELARKALAILDANCGACHGPNGRGEGHALLDFILDVKKLTTDEDKHYVVPGDADQSLVMKRIKSKKRPMPPPTDGDKVVTQRPSDADVAVLEAWIKAGAPTAGTTVAQAARSFITTDKMLDLMFADLDAMKRPIDRQHTRYFILTPLYNANVPDAQLDLYRAGLAKLVNCLSPKNPRIVLPKPIDPARTIFRIDLRDYSWNEQTWDNVLSSYPYGVAPRGSTAQAICDATNCRMPFLRADWFVFVASKPPLYEDILGIPTTVQELEKQLGIDRDDDIQRERVARAGFNKSGVSNNNRVLERHEFAHGAYYISGDFGSNSDEEHKNIFSHPLDYVPDGGEVIYNLPNGLQAYMLVNKDGERIEEGPLNIVHDPGQPREKGAVINGISCMSCHDKGMKDKDDEIRAHVLASPTAFTEDEKDKVLALYPEKAVFRKLLEEDAERFRKACEKTGATFDKPEAIKTLTSRFEEELDLSLAAAELGLTADEFRKVLDDNGDLGKVFGVLKIDGGTVKREVWEAKFGDFVSAAGIGVLQGAIAAAPAVDRLRDEVKRAMDAGDVKKAFDLLDKALDKDPKNPDLLEECGDVRRDNSDLDGAIADYQAAYDNSLLPLTVVAKLASAYDQRADKEVGLGKLAAAIDDLQKAVDLMPDDAGLHVDLATVYLLNKNYDEAIDEASAAIEKNDQLAIAYKLRGTAYLKRNDEGDRAAARDDFERADELEKDK
jgi:tetratricopeptide (TPR) repeat protein/cytochrome c553